MEIHGEDAFGYLEDYSDGGNLHPKVKDYFDLKKKSSVGTDSPSEEPTL